jgi:hypothetical protein
MIHHNIKVVCRLLISCFPHDPFLSSRPAYKQPRSRLGKPCGTKHGHRNENYCGHPCVALIGPYSDGAVGYGSEIGLCRIWPTQ